MWAVHASIEKEGSWRLAVWLEYMIPPFGKRTEVLGLAGACCGTGDWWWCTALCRRYQRWLVKMNTDRGHTVVQ